MEFAYALVIVLSGSIFDTGLRYPTYLSCIEAQVDEVEHQLAVNRGYTHSRNETGNQRKDIPDWAVSALEAEKWTDILDQKAITAYQQMQCLIVAK